MTTIQEKKAMKILNYYNEMSSYSNEVQYPNVLFLGIEYINDNPLLRFQLKSGKQFRRQINDNGMYYEHVPSENDDNIKDEDKKNIKFSEIKNEDNSNKIN
jgi:hypothetical protein